MTDPAINPIREQLRLEGFDLIDERLRYLLGCLEEALVSTGEKELLPFLPWSGREPEIGAAPAGLPQLYSIGFQLLNMVEERVAAEIRREREKVFGTESIRGLWHQALRDLRTIGLDRAILDVLHDVHVEPVLTAHPTEAKRTSVGERYRALYDDLVRNEYPKYTERERRRLRDRIAATLETLWHTAEIHLVRPDITSDCGTRPTTSATCSRPPEPARPAFHRGLGRRRFPLEAFARPATSRGFSLAPGSVATATGIRWSPPQSRKRPSRNCATPLSNCSNASCGIFLAAHPVPLPHAGAGGTPGPPRLPGRTVDAPDVSGNSRSPRGRTLAAIGHADGAAAAGRSRVNPATSPRASPISNLLSRTLAASGCQ